MAQVLEIFFCNMGWDAICGWWMIVGQFRKKKTENFFKQLFQPKNGYMKRKGEGAQMRRKKIHNGGVIRRKSTTLSTLIMLIVVMLLITSAYATVLCSYKGPDVSEHDLQLSDFEISGDKTVRVDDKVSVSFKLAYAGRTGVTFDDKYGIFIAAEDPDGKIRSFGNTYQGKKLKELDFVDFKTDIIMDKGGEWVLWPSYCIKTGKGILPPRAQKCGPEEWHSCHVKVEAKAPVGGVSWVPFIPDARPGTHSMVIPKSRDTMGLCVDSNFFGMYRINTTVNGTQFHHLQVPNAGHTTVVGKPAVPMITRYFEIPHDVDLSVEILYLDEQVLDGYNVIPAQEPPRDFPNATQPAFVLDEATYTTDAFFPSYTASQEGEEGRQPIIIRGNRLVALSLYPVQFNPVTQQVKVHSKIEVRLNYNRPAQVEAIDKRLESPAFEELCQAFILNYRYRPGVIKAGPSSPSPPMNDAEDFPSWSENSEYLIITHDNFFQEVLPLADWKEKKGLTTKIVNTSEIVPSGPTADDIADYIQDAYDTWNPAPSYVLLVGDSDFIPTHYRNPHPSDKHGGFATATDLYYATVDGTDYFPDIYVGRLSVDTAAQATTIINKILDYERPPPADADFYSNASACAYFQDEEEEGMTRRDGFEDKPFVLTSEEIRNYLLAQGYTVDRIYTAETDVTPTNYSPAPGDYYFWDYGNPLPAALLRPGFAWNGGALNITKAISDGRFLVYHRGHGVSGNFWNHDAENWSLPDGLGDLWVNLMFGTRDLSRLTNSNSGELPVVFSVECQCGWFDNEIDEKNDGNLTRNYDCFCEEFTRLPNGGAIAAIGATRDSYSGHNDALLKGFIDAIWPGFDPAFPSGGLFSLGQVLTYGKAYMANVYGYSGSFRDDTMLTFELYHLFGDPELPIWTAQPEALDVTPLRTIGSGRHQEFVVTVNDSAGAAVYHARICLRKENDIHESVYTNTAGQAFFDVTPSSGGQMDITVTKHNYRPYEGSITVTSDGATLSVDPVQGPSGILVDIVGSGFDDDETVNIDFGGTPTTAIASGGSFTKSDFTVLSGAEGHVNVVAQTSGRTAVALFRRLPFQPLPDPYIYDQWDSSTWYLNPDGGDPIWNNPCIELFDDHGDSVSSNDLKAGKMHTIRATIYNDATEDAVDTDVTFEWADWGAGQGTWYPIDTDTVTVPAATGTVSGTATAEADWTPSRTGHTCLWVTIHHPLDENLDNNKGQENTDVLHVSSPGVISFPVNNPTKTTALVYVEVRQIGEKTIWPATITRDYPQVQEPGEKKTVNITVDAPAEAHEGEKRIFTATAYINGEVIGGIETKVDVRREVEPTPTPIPVVVIIVVIVTVTVAVAVVGYSVYRRKHQGIGEPTNARKHSYWNESMGQRAELLVKSF